jgi:uncharacterized coiled-coil DUF342 family protein
MEELNWMDNADYANLSTAEMVSKLQQLKAEADELRSSAVWWSERANHLKAENERLKQTDSEIVKQYMEVNKELEAENERLKVEVKERDEQLNELIKQGLL